jgi:hypothetical protein
MIRGAVRYALRRGAQSGRAMAIRLHPCLIGAPHRIANQPARPAQLVDGNDRAIIVQSDDDLLNSFGWDIATLH